MWVWLWSQNGHNELSSEACQSIAVLINEDYSIQEIAKKMKIFYKFVYYSLHSITQTGSNQDNKRGERPRKMCFYGKGKNFVWFKLLNSCVEMHTYLSAQNYVRTNLHLMHRLYEIKCYMSANKESGSAI